MTQIPQLLTQDALLSWSVIEPVVGMKKTKRDAMIKEGKFPAPIPLGPKMNRWPASAIDTWLRGQLAKAARVPEAECAKRTGVLA